LTLITVLGWDKTTSLMVKRPGSFPGLFISNKSKRKFMTAKRPRSCGAFLLSVVIRCRYYSQIVPNAPRKIRRSPVVIDPSPLRSAGHGFAISNSHVPLSETAVSS